MLYTRVSFHMFTEDEKVFIKRVRIMKTSAVECMGRWTLRDYHLEAARYISLEGREKEGMPSSCEESLAINLNIKLISPISTPS